MKVAALVSLMVLDVGVLWLAREQHGRNCQDAGRTGCSILPWVNGENEGVRPRA